MKDRDVRLAGKLRSSVEAVEAALAAGDIAAATRATEKHHRLLNRAAVLAAENFRGTDVVAFSGGGEKDVPDRPPEDEEEEN